MNSLTDQDPRAPEGARGHESGGQIIGPTTVVRYGRIDPRGGWSVLIYSALISRVDCLPEVVMLPLISASPYATSP